MPTITTVDLTQRYPDNIFRIAATDEQAAQALGRYLDREQKGKKLTVVYNEIFYMRAIADMVRLALPAEFQTSAHFEPLLDVPGVTDRLADKLLRDPPDIIYLALDAGPLFEFVGKLRARGIKSLLIGGQHLLSQTVWRQAGNAIEGVLVIAPISLMDNPKFQEAVDLLNAGGCDSGSRRSLQFCGGADLGQEQCVGLAAESQSRSLKRCDLANTKRLLAPLHSMERAIGAISDYSVLTLQAGRLTPRRANSTATLKS